MSRPNGGKRTRTGAIVIGGGQAGLAMSRRLTDQGRDHVVLERGRIAERWRSERWDSVRLLTPNWQTRLPGWSYQGPDPDGFMTMPELVGYFEDYARSFEAPVLDGTTVTSVRREHGHYLVDTDTGSWIADDVVVATGYSDRPFVPPVSTQMSPDLHQLAPSDYRNPDQLPAGGVLVVGASASGAQIADELIQAGRDVILSVGRHTRLPRRYRGLDIMWWLDQMGTLDDTVDDVSDIAAARAEPSLQLVGRPTHDDLDLALLQEHGVRLAGRLAGADGQRVRFADDLYANTAAADARLRRVLSRIDAFIDRCGLTTEVDDPTPIQPVHPAAMCDHVDLAVRGVSNVIWATGFRREYPWLHVPVLDDRGEIRHDRGVCPVPGLYVMGLRFQIRRKSSFIDGVGDDAAELAEHMAARHHHHHRSKAMVRT
jgi:putative flavoprotein involved in K+ transport